MKKYINRKFISVFILCLLFVFILSLKFWETKNKHKIAYIFQTSDIHGYLEHRPLDKNGGWLRLGYIIEKEIKASGGKKNCLLVDCGDTFQGSIEAAITKGSFAIKALNLLNYDVFVPGNHDFDYGINYLQHIISKLNADVLAANLKIKDNTKIKPWKLYVINDIKIAVIGMTSPYIKYWIGRKNTDRYSVASITNELNKIIPEIIEVRPEVIILALHHGLYNSKRFSGEDRLLRNVIRKFPEIDIVLGGHTHQPYSGELIYANSIFIQPGAHGSYLSKIKIEIEKLNNETPKIETELIPVTSHIPVHNDLMSAVGDTIKKVDIKSQETIIVLKKSIDSGGNPGENCKMSKLFAEAILYSAESDAAMCTVLVPNKVLKNKVTYDDIYEVCPYEDSIMIITLNLDELKEIVKEQNQFKSKYRKKLGLYIKKNQEIVGVKNTEELASYFKNNEKIKLALSSYDVAGAGNRYPVLRRIVHKNKRMLYDTNMLLREMIIQYFLKKNNKL